MSSAGLRYRNPALQSNPPMRNAQDQQPGADRALFYVDFFVYVVPISATNSIAASATSVQQLQVQADSDFEWIECTITGNLHGGAAPFADTIFMPITVQIVDGGSGRQLLSAPTPFQSIGGSGKQPFILPESRVFKARTNIQFTFVNLDAANVYDNVFMNLIGRKIFQFGPGQRP